MNDDNSEDAVESTLSSDLEKDDLNNQEETLHQEQVHRVKIIRTTRVPLPKKQIHADTIIEVTSLPNLRHPAWTMSPPLLKFPKSTITILCESDIVATQVLQLPKAGRDHSIPQPQAGGDHNVPQHQTAPFGVAKQFMKASVFTKTPWSVIFDGKYWMVDEAWQLAITAQDQQWALAGASVGAPSVC